MLKEFKEFIMRGNVLDLAIAVIIGAAFGKIVTSLVDDIIMPPVGLLLGNVDFTNLFYNLGDKPYATLAEAKAAAAPTINYGIFINQIISFVIVAFVIFFIVRAANRLKSKQDAPTGEPTTKDCPFCLSTIPLKATRCAECCVDLQSA